MCFLWNVFYKVQMQRLFEHRRLHPDSLLQTVNMGCRQTQSSSEAANEITEIEGGWWDRGICCHNQLLKMLAREPSENESFS